MLDSLTVSLSVRLPDVRRLPARGEARYSKQGAPFSDTVAYMRRRLWSQQYFQMSRTKGEMIKIPRVFFELLN
jgi:hypothetical protein